MDGPVHQFIHNPNYEPSLSPPPPSPDREPTPPAFTTNGQHQPNLYNPSVSTQTASAGGQTGKAEQATKPKVARPRKPKDPNAPPRKPKDPNAPPSKPRVRKPKDPDAPPPKKRQRKADVAVSGSESKPTIIPQPATNQSSLGFAPTSSPHPPQVYGSTVPALSKIETAAQQTSAPFGTIPPTSQSHNRVPSQQRAAFDPIRSASLENARLANTPTPTPASVYQSPNHSMASPNGHAMAGTPKRNNSVTSTQQAMARPTSTPPPRPVIVQSQRPTPTKIAPAPAAVTSSTVPPQTTITKKIAQLDGTATTKSVAKAPVREMTPPRPASPKPVVKKRPSPKPLGNGLLSGADFGKKASSEPKQYAQVPNDCIVIDVPITGRTNNYVNFLKEVENKYGFDAAYPRIAEHKRRMAKMAADGAALENGATGTADEMSVDLSSMEESDVEMTGVNGEESGTATDAKKKKKKGPSDKYNLDDDFIDDTEQAWTEQALASKDGYFVWSGPLIQEGDTPQIERADGTVKRGRSTRGKAGATRGGGAARGGKTDTGEKKSTRGTGKPRGPRKKPSDREMVEKEKERLLKEAADEAAGNRLMITTNGTEFPGVVGAA